jgi:hypothetical protein
MQLNLISVLRQILVESRMRNKTIKLVQYQNIPFLQLFNVTPFLDYMPSKFVVVDV